jgi:hypothetical protein
VEHTPGTRQVYVCVCACRENARACVRARQRERERIMCVTGAGEFDIRGLSHAHVTGAARRSRRAISITRPMLPTASTAFSPSPEFNFSEQNLSAF